MFILPPSFCTVTPGLKAFCLPICHLMTVPGIISVSSEWVEEGLSIYPEGKTFPQLTSYYKTD